MYRSNLTQITYSTLKFYSVRWKLSQELGVTQSTTYPVVFGYRFNNSKASSLASVCPTSDSYTILYNILIDARQNFQVQQISIDKNMAVVYPDGIEQDISKWLKPTRLNPRTDRPAFNVEETEHKLIISLIEKNELEELEVSVLEDSLKKMSIEQLDISASINFEPRYYDY